MQNTLMPVFFAPGDQRLENLFLRHSDGLCGMDAAQILLVEFIKCASRQGIPAC